jgi:predicted hydrocarbon binding protein
MSLTWKELGNIKEGRGNLGLQVDVEIYRLMQFSLKEALENDLGPQKAKELFVKAGRIAGREFTREKLDTSLSITDFIARLHDTLIDIKVGILRLEKSDLDNMHFIITVSEDLDCSGLSIQNKTVCDFDEGFIEGIFNEYTGRDFRAVEIDCWALGGRTCRFEVKAV